MKTSRLFFCAKRRGSRSKAFFFFGGKLTSIAVNLSPFFVLHCFSGGEKMEFSFPARIQSLCKEKGICPDDLRKQGSIAPRTWRGLMSGKTRNPSLRTILKICKALGISPSEFFRTSVRTPR